MDIKDFYARYHENYKTVLADIQAQPKMYRGVNLRLCDKKSIFERFNHYEQFGTEWAYEPKIAPQSPLKRLFPAQIALLHDTKHVQSLSWGKVPSQGMIFSASRAPRLYLSCLIGGRDYYQFTARDLYDQIDNFHHMFQTMPRLKTVILDEDISPDKNALCQVARQYWAKSTVICHGQLGIITGFLPLTADYMQVKYPEQKEKLIKWGLEPYKIITTSSKHP